MPARQEDGEPADASYVSTGHLPPPDLVQGLVSEAYERFKSVPEGKSSDVYPALARVPGELFGICVVGTSGNVYAVGDAEHEFSIMSVSKPFVLALVCQSLGHEEVRRRLGVNATGLPFNSLTAIERSGDGRTNPMVNSGAIATTSLVPGASADDRWRFIHDGLSRFAAGPFRSTRRSTPPRPPPISGTGASPGCSRASTGSTWTQPRPPTSTPGSAR